MIKKIIHAYILLILFSFFYNLSAQDLTEGLVAYYPFNGNANDESGNGNDGTVYGAKLVLDRFENENSAYQFDGNDDYLLHTTNGFNSLSGSMSGWFNPNGNYKMGFWQTHNSNNINWSDWIAMFMWDSDRFYFRVGNGTSFTDLNFSNSLITTNQWSHVVFTWGSSTLKVYVNGSEVASGNVTLQSQIDPYARLGYGHQNSMDGKIDDVKFYNRVLSEAEIVSLYHEQQINLLNPVADQNLFIGSNQNITWEYSESKSINIDLSLNNGSSWQNITQNVPESQSSYQWIVPSTPSILCKIRISDTEDANIYDENEGTFTISMAPKSIFAEPDELHFPILAVSSASNLNVNLLSEGSEAVTVSSTAVGTSHFSSESFSGAIAPGESEEISVTFQPQSEGIFQDTLLISSDAQNSPQIRIPISGSTNGWLTCAIDSISGLKPYPSGEINIHYTISNSGSDYTGTSNWQYSVDSQNWIDINSFSIGNDEANPNGSYYISWDSEYENGYLYNQYDDSVWFRMQVTDGINYSNWGVSEPFAINNDHRPKVHINRITGNETEPSDTVSIHYTTTDPDGDQMQCINFEYRIASGDWRNVSEYHIVNNNWISSGSHTLYWLSHLSLPGQELAQVQFRMKITDNVHESAAYSKSATFSLDNNRPPSIWIGLPHYFKDFKFEDDLDEFAFRENYYTVQQDPTQGFKSEGSAKLSINSSSSDRGSIYCTAYGYNSDEYPYIIFDYKSQDGFPVNIMVNVNSNWYQYRLSGGGGYTEIGSASLNQDNQWHRLSINIDQALGAGNHYIREVIMGNWQEKGTGYGKSLWIDNFRIAKYRVSETTDTIKISYRITDPESDAIDLDCEYSLDEGQSWQAATMIESLENISNANYSGTLNWLAKLDVPDGVENQNVYFRISPSDADQGERAEINQIEVDFNDVPEAQLYAVPGTITGDRPISYALVDSENDALSIKCYYSLDGDSTWQEATVSGQTDNITGYSGQPQTITWKVMEDIPNTTPDGINNGGFKIVPSDLDEGIAGISHQALKIKTDIPTSMEAFAAMGDSIIRIDFNESMGSSITNTDNWEIDNDLNIENVSSGTFNIDDNTVLLFDFSEGQGNVLHDLSGNDNHASILGPTWNLDENNSPILYFDGSNDILSIPEHPTLDITRQLTVSIRLRISSFQYQWMPVMYKGAGGSTSAARSYTLWVNSSKYFLFTSYDYSGQQSVSTAYNSISENTWITLTGIIDRDAVIMKVYFDTTLMVEGSLRNNDNVNTNNPLLFGYTQESSSNYKYFHGYIGAIKISKKAQIPKFINTETNNLYLSLDKVITSDKNNIILTLRDVTDVFGNPVSEVSTMFIPDDGNENPSIALTEISEEQSGDVVINYQISDAENDTTDIECTYQIVGDTIWHAAAVEGATSNIVQFNGSIAWNSQTDLDEVDTEVNFRIKPRNKNYDANGTADEIRFHLDNNQTPTIMIDPLTELYFDRVPLNYELTDREDDVLNILVEYSINGTSWIKATTEGALSDLSSDDYSGIITWLSKSDLESTSDTVWVRITPRDNDTGSPAVQNCVINNAGKVFAEIKTPFAAEENADVTISYQINDPTGQNQLVSLSAYFSTTDGSSWQNTSQITGDISELDSSKYTGSLIWHSENDLPGVDNNQMRFRLIPTTEVTGFSQMSTRFHLDNNKVPFFRNINVATKNGGKVVVDFELSDAENDVLSINGHYRQNAGEWKAATLSDHNNISNYNNALYWLAYADLTYGRQENLEIKLSVSDKDLGETDSSNVFNVDIYAGDYDGDRRVDDMDDLIEFATGWRDVDLNKEIGPAMGTLPYLTPQRDGKFDFEDLAVFTQMWNWFYSHPSGKEISFAPLTKTADEFNRIEVKTEHQTVFNGPDHVTLMLQGVDIDKVLAMRVLVNYDSQRVALEETKTSHPMFHFSKKMEDFGLIFLDSSEVQEKNLLEMDFIQTDGGDSRFELLFELYNRSAQPVENGRFETSVSMRDIIPKTFAVNPAYPNPFNPKISLEYQLPEQLDVKVIIYDVLGRRIRNLHNSKQDAGYYNLSWDANDGNGQKISSGLYFIIVKAGSHLHRQKVILLK